MTEDTHRQVAIERITNSHYTVTNARGGTITVGTADTTDFSPVELLLVSIGACTAIDVDILTSRRAEPDSFTVAVDAEKLRDEKGRNYLADITVTFRIRFPEGEDGDKARALLPDAVKQSHDRLCTVSRTVELGTPVTPLIE
jgi:putative redox protein